MPSRPSLAILSACLLWTLPMGASGAEMRPNVTFLGALEAEGTERRVMQEVIFDFADAWANCNPAAMERSMAPDVAFAYPTTSYSGLDRMLADLEVFCGQATDTSFYMPKDAFYLDEANDRVAVEIQFRTFQRGSHQVVNDMWIMTVKDGKATVVKEYLDGRVKDLQALGVLELERDPEFMTPWPPRTEQWADCFPIAKAAPINQCPAE